MPSAAAHGILGRLLIRLVFGVRRRVLERPAARAALRTLGRPVIRLMHRLTGLGGPPPAVTPSPSGEPVLRLPLDYVPGPLAKPPRIAVVILAAVADGLDELLAAAARMPFATELHVGVNAQAHETVAAVLARVGGGQEQLRRGAALTAFTDLVASDALLLVLRTGGVAAEREAAVRSLLGSEAAVRSVVEIFAYLPRLGLLAPRTPASARARIAWGADYPACRDMAARLGFPLYVDSPLDMPAGGMFWARGAALQPLLALDDGVAADKLVFHACEHAGYRWVRAGDDAQPQGREVFWRAEMPRRLERAVTDCGRTVLLPGRPPHPQGLPARGAPDVAKQQFRERCREELAAFLASGERLGLRTSATPQVSLVLVVFNQAELTYQCLRSLSFALDLPSEVIVVDNASSDETDALLQRLDGVRIVRNAENLHFLRGVNQAADLAAGDYLLLLNNDTRLHPGSIAAAVERLEQEADLGAVGGKIELLDGTLQEAGSIVWQGGSCLGYGRGADPWAPEFQFRRDVDYCSGAFLMLRRDLFERLGRLDTAFAPAYYEETDLCLRIWEAGLRVAYDPRIQISHFEFGSAATSEAALALQRDHQGLFAQRHADSLANHQPPGAHPLLARQRGRYAGRLLVLDDQAPFPHLGSGYPRALDILHAAAQAGWFITFLPLAHPDVDYQAAYEVLPPDVEFAAELGGAGLPGFMRERVGYYDAVLVSRPHNMAIFRDALARAPRFISLDRVIYDAEAIFALRDKARAELGLGGPPPVDELADELALAKGVGAVLAVNAVEAENFRGAGAGQVFVVGHALESEPTQATFAARRDLLFVGALDEDEAPNVDSLVFFVREVMPRLDALIGDDYVLRIAGRSGAPRVRALAGPRVELLGRVEDLQPLYDASRVFIAPTRFAAGIPMKVHAAAAAGLPVVVTTLLARQLGWGDGEALLVADDPADFAQAIRRLYEDAALWMRLREGALARVRAECDPAAFSRIVAGALASVRRT